MDTKFKMYVVNVFVDENGRFGNPVGVILDESRAIPDQERQKICIESGFSEVTFINSLEDRDISIFSPTGEIAFAGHAVLGTVYVLNEIGTKRLQSIYSHGNEIKIRYEGEMIWVEADLKAMPGWNFRQYERAEDLEKLRLADTVDFEHCYAWSWIDQESGILRARTFAPDWDIPEDEANGSGSMLLASELGRSIVVHHGKGSIIYANPVSEESAEVGGFVQESEEPFTS